VPEERRFLRDRAALIEGGIAVALLGALIVACLTILRPFISPILLAGVLVHATWGGQAWLAPRIGRSWGAAVMVLLAACVLVVPLALVVPGLAANLQGAGDVARRIGAALPLEAPDWIVGLPLIGNTLDGLWTEVAPALAEGGEALRFLIEPYTGALGRMALSFAIAVAEGLLELLFALLVAFFLYRDGEALVGRLRAMAVRLGRSGALELVQLTGDTVRSVVWGLIGTAMIQGLMAWIGFMIAGVPGAAVLGFMTVLLSIVQIGAPILWGGAAAWLFAEGETGWGLFMIVWGGIAVSSTDNVVRPWLISRGAKLPLILIILGVIGGLLAFGFLGLFLGPVLLAVAWRLVERWTERAARGGEGGPGGGPGGGQPGGESGGVSLT
jgi:predicted PurR-regulated permease PerM